MPDDLILTSVTTATIPNRAFIMIYTKQSIINDKMLFYCLRQTLGSSLRSAQSY